MPDMDRRRFSASMLIGAAGLAAGMVGGCATTAQQAAGAAAGDTAKVKALLFDAFPVFDPRPIFAKVAKLFPEHGEALSLAWRTRQFEYTWLRTAAGRYQDFWQVTRDALVYAGASIGVDVSDATVDELMQSYLELRPWPDAAEALAALREDGYRLAFLSNFTPRMLETAIEGSGLGDTFEHVISTDRAKTYKPAPKAYALGEKVFGLARDEMAFVAFAGWDAAGAAWYGYPTFWVNRLKLPPEELGVRANASGNGLDGLVQWVRRV